MTADEELKIENDIQKVSFRIDILIERESEHYYKSGEKFTEIQKKLKEDPRL